MRAVDPACRGNASGQPEGSPSRRSVVVVADDFGSSSSVNRAVALAHDQGILTCTSLMAGGEAFAEAVHLARERPGLSVGLHLTLCDGCSVLPPSRIPDLVGLDRRLAGGPTRAGLRYLWFRKRLLLQLEAEVDAQFERLEAAGIHPHHLDSHHHLHMHPVLFDIACRRAVESRVSWVRLPGEDLLPALGLDPPWRVGGQLFSSGFLSILRRRNRRVAAERGLRSADRLYGLFRTGWLDEAYLLALLPRMRGALNEIYTHPDETTRSGRRELSALLSRGVRAVLRSERLELTSYRALDEGRGGQAAP